MGTFVKICGIKTEEDVALVNQYRPDYAGFVLFFEKSKRNLTMKQAEHLLALCRPDIQKVAVVVDPTVEQMEQIGQLPFDIVQVHKRLSKEAYDACQCVIWRVFNLSDIEQYDQEKQKEKITGFVFDAAEYGSGKTFDWKLLNHLERTEKTFVLAGGLTKDNVLRAIKEVQPDVCDVSSGVEKDRQLIGKDEEKVRDFIRMVHYGE